MTLPQLIFVVCATANVAAHLALDGKPQPHQKRFDFVGTLWRTLALSALLWWGGFFQ